MFCAQILDVDAHILEVQMPHVEICAFVLDTDPYFQGCGNLVYSGSGHGLQVHDGCGFDGGGGGLTGFVGLGLSG
tara:strand:- start:28 stop:252 length:225 start_codon:yes stop_codon:yes gene_type:complete